jgi:uncharacterized protein (TIGR00730 family)
MADSKDTEQQSSERVPTPAHPSQRRTALPWCSPKAEIEDPSVPGRIERIMEDPSYRQADQDVDFLNHDDTRGLRLQLDYLKPESLMEAHGIMHSIVVFGSTRIAEPRAAQRRVDELSAALAAAPGDAGLARDLSIARRVLAKSHYYQVARDFAGLVGEAEGPHGNRLVVVTGGGPGIMEAANRGAHETGARTVGLNISLPREQYPNPYITPGLCFRFHYFGLRKLHFLMRARALVVFPGGYGTLDELFETLTLIQTRKITPVPVILVGEAYWRRVFDPEFLVEEGVIDPEDRELFWYAETAEDIWADILRWYELAGRSLTA